MDEISLNIVRHDCRLPQSSGENAGLANVEAQAADPLAYRGNVASRRKEKMQSLMFTQSASVRHGSRIFARQMEKDFIAVPIIHA